ncbi:MAG: hypothetical protein WA057_00390 [Candidatus Magasanikiibacteriota bacterium]
MNNSQNFLCPECRQKQLAIGLSYDIEPDEYNDEARLQTIICKNCNFQGIALYQESHRGNLDETNFTHTGYTVPKELFKQTKTDIQNRQIKNIKDYIDNSFGKFKMELVDN